MGKRQRRNRDEETLEEEVGMTPKFGLGNSVQIGDDQWVVKGYQKVGTGNSWGVIFRPVAGGKDRTIPCVELEQYVGK